jgi:hypothetical protein
MCSDGVDEGVNGDEDAIVYQNSADVRYVRSPLPLKDWREEFGNQALIVWAEGLSVNGIIVLAV